MMEAGYRLHLANTAVIVQYSGLKYRDDDSDTGWLAKGESAPITHRVLRGGS
jgi:transposase